MQKPGRCLRNARGVHAAVVLAGYGFPVAPFDPEGMRILAEPSGDIDTVLDLFSGDKGAYVGYSTCEAPFYLLLTDCVRTLRRLVPVHPRLSDVRELFARVGRPLPPDSRQSFVHGMAIVGRQPGDTISTVGYLILIRRRGQSRCMPGGTRTANLVGLPTRDMSPSRGSC